jgi:ADP-heptose:LPS heptosyltransferase
MTKSDSQWKRAARAAYAIGVVALDGLVLILASLHRTLRTGIIAARLPASRKRIVFIRPDQLGDLVLWSASFSALRDLYPKASYDWVWVGQPEQEPLVRLFGLFDECIVVDTRRFQARACLLYRLRIVWRLAHCSANLVLHPVRSRTVLVGDSLARGVDAPVKIASRGDSANAPAWLLRLGDCFYTRVLPWHGPAHELEFTADFLSQLGWERSSATLPDARGLTGGAPLIPDSYFVVLPGAGWRGREWGGHHFVAAATQIQKEHEWLCVWAGSTEEYSRLADSLAHPGLRALNLMGKTTSAELLRLLSGAQLVLSNEAGGAHLAAACRVPSIVVTGGGHIDRFVPWGTMTSVVHRMSCFGCNWRCIHSRGPSDPVPCVAVIDVAAVSDAVARALAPHAHSHA